MKLSKFFLIGAVAFGLAACNNEDVPDVQQQDGTLSLRITQSGVSSVTKATGDAAEIAKAESFIHKLDVFVFKGDGVEVHASAKATAGTPVNRVEGIPVTAGKSTIVVLANAPESVADIKSESELMAIINTDLASQTLTNGLLMCGDTIITIVTGENYFGYPAAQTGAAANFSVGAPLQLTRVVARVALMGVSVGFQAPYDKWKYVNENVFLFNAKKQSNYFGPSLVQGAEFLSGLDLDAFNGQLKPTNWIPEWTTNYLIDTVQDYTAINARTPVYYYTFENDNVASPTCISLRGKLYDAGGIQVTRGTHSQYSNIKDIVDVNGYTYFTVIVNGANVGYTYNGVAPDPEVNNSTIKRNTQYNITLNIIRLGLDDPTEIIENANLNVEVEVTPWVIVEQEVVW